MVWAKLFRNVSIYVGMLNVTKLQKICSSIGFHIIAEKEEDTSKLKIQVDTMFVLSPITMSHAITVQSI